MEETIGERIRSVVGHGAFDPFVLGQLEDACRAEKRRPGGSEAFS